MSEPRPWHRLFGLSLVDFFRGMPVRVELEKDLSLKQQLLDVVIIRTEVTPLPCRLPDGFEELAAHNLVSFKSYQEALDGWALQELLGHYVNYRKQASPSMQELLPESDFRLFAVCVRFPQALARQVTLTPVQPGVYDVRHFTGLLRLVVVHELPQQEHNALLHLFSARTDLLQYGATHYQLRSEETSTLLLQLFQRYRLEATLMPDLLRELADETIEELFKTMPVERRLRGLSVDDLLAALPAETRAALVARATVKGLSVDDLLAALPPETQAALAQRLTHPGSLPKPEASESEHGARKP
ncbi:MAG: hypothetical protein L0Z62_49620 [Gemmataceae bacterium]|nr:hypothetical protein [Gemmataceae bacterium]